MVPGAGKHVVHSAGEHIKMVPGAGKRKRLQAKENSDWSLNYFFASFLSNRTGPQTSNWIAQDR